MEFLHPALPTSSCIIQVNWRFEKWTPHLRHDSEQLRERKLLKRLSAPGPFCLSLYYIRWTTGKLWAVAAPFLPPPHASFLCTAWLSIGLEDKNLKTPDFGGSVQWFLECSLSCCHPASGVKAPNILHLGPVWSLLHSATHICCRSAGLRHPWMGIQNAPFEEVIVTKVFFHSK